MDHTEQIPEVSSATATPPDAPARRVSYRSGSSPWRRRDQVICGLLAVLGLAGLVTCWFGATDEVVWRDQTGWLIGSIFCAGLVALGGGLWVLIGLRRVRQGFRDLRRDQRTVLGLSRARSAGTAADKRVAVADGELVTTGQMTRAHRPECLLMRGKPATPVPPVEVTRYGSCGVCNS